MAFWRDGRVNCTFRFKNVQRPKIDGRQAGLGRLVTRCSCIHCTPNAASFWDGMRTESRKRLTEDGWAVFSSNHQLTSTENARIGIALSLSPYLHFTARTAPHIRTSNPSISTSSWWKSPVLLIDSQRKGARTGCVIPARRMING